MASLRKAIVDNREPDANANPNYVFKHLKLKIAQLFEKHRNAAIHWFQNGHPMKSWITESEDMLGVGEKNAEKFSEEWYNIKRA